jgi:hypothetical protein
MCALDLHVHAPTVSFREQIDERPRPRLGWLQAHHTGSVSSRECKALHWPALPACVTLLLRFEVLDWLLEHFSDLDVELVLVLVKVPIPPGALRLRRACAAALRCSNQCVRACGPAMRVTHGSCRRGSIGAPGVAALMERLHAGVRRAAAARESGRTQRAGMPLGPRILPRAQSSGNQSASLALARLLRCHPCHGAKPRQFE